MVTVVVCPAGQVLGVIDEMDGTSPMQSVCAWQKVEENSSKSVAAWRSGPTIAPPFDPRDCAWVKSFRRVGYEMKLKSEFG